MSGDRGALAGGEAAAGDSPAATALFPASPWIQIWIRPRETIRTIVRSDPDRHAIAIMAVTGFLFALGITPFQRLVERPEFMMSIAGRWISQPVLAVIGLYVFAKLLRWTGRWIGGTAPTSNLRAAIAWPSLWLIVAGLVWLVERAVLSSDLRLPSQLGVRQVVMIAWALDGLRYGLLTGFLVQHALAVSEVQGFAVWRGLVNVVLAVLVLAVPLVAVFGGVIYLFIER